METTLTLYVRYLAKPGCRESFLRQLTTEGIIDAIRREDGCLRYDYFLSVQNADEILLVEQWESEEKQQVHLRAAHMDRLRELKAQYGGGAPGWVRSAWTEGPAMLFDTHAHYDDDQFDPDREALLASLPEHGVGLVVNPGCTVASSRRRWSWPIVFPISTLPWASIRKTAAISAGAPDGDPGSGPGG